MLYIVFITQTALGLLIIMGFAICGVAIVIFVGEQCENWTDKRRLQRIEKDYEKFLQLQRKRRVEKDLHRKEQEKYPLFFWRELTAKNLDVIEEKLEDE